MTRRLFDKPRRDQAGSGVGRRQGTGIFRIVEKTQVGCAGGIERRDVADRTIGRVAGAKLGPGQSRNRAGGELAIGYDKIPHVAGVALRRDQNTAPRKPLSLGRKYSGYCISKLAPQYIVPPRASLLVPGVMSRGPMPAGWKPRTRLGPIL